MLRRAAHSCGLLLKQVLYFEELSHSVLRSAAQSHGPFFISRCCKCKSPAFLLYGLQHILAEALKLSPVLNQFNSSYRDEEVEDEEVVTTKMNVPALFELYGNLKLFY